LRELVWPGPGDRSADQAAHLGRNRIGRLGRHGAGDPKEWPDDAQADLAFLHRQIHDRIAELWPELQSAVEFLQRSCERGTVAAHGRLPRQQAKMLQDESGVFDRVRNGRITLTDIALPPQGK